ncbi:hypothetical protein C8C83_0118 [Flavobacterium sp. 90]|nr:hypothetical protein C8C82_0410 [Flavobacterium sp. 81]TCK52328.1 hypothetical protein C8C83_0118 [Flavobacterium sp. 90]
MSESPIGVKADRIFFAFVFLAGFLIPKISLIYCYNTLKVVAPN